MQYLILFCLLFSFLSTNCIGQPSQPISEARKEFLNLKMDGDYYLQKEYYDLALEKYLKAYASKGRTFKDNLVSCCIEKAKDALVGLLNQNLISLERSQIRIDSLALANENKVIEIIESENRRSQSEEEAETLNTQKLGLKLALLANQKRISKDFQEAYYLVLRALELSDDNTRTDITYYYSMIVRDSFIENQIPIKESFEDLIIFPNHYLTIDADGLNLFNSSSNQAIQNFEDSRGLPLVDSEAIILYNNDTKALSLFNIPSDQSKELEKKHKEPLTFASNHEDFNLTAGRDNTVQIWNKLGGHIGQLIGHNGNIYDVAYLKANEKFVTRSSDGSLRIWNKSGQPIKKLTQAPYIYEFCIDDQQKSIAASTANNEIIIWSTDDILDAPLKTISVKNAITRLSFFSGDTTKLFALNSSKKLTTWTVDTKEVIQDSIFPNVEDYLIIPSQPAFLTWDSTGIVSYHSLKEKETFQWLAHDKKILGIDYNPVDNTLLSTGSDNLVKWWDLDGQQLLHWPVKKISPNLTAKFSYNGKYFLIPYYINEGISVHKIPQFSEIIQKRLEKTAYPELLKRNYKEYFSEITKRK